MIRDDDEVEYETTAIQTDEPVLLPSEKIVLRDQGWSWVVLLASFLTLFITNGVHASFGVLYAALISHFKSGFEETAWIGSISLGLLCFFSPIASLLIEQIGCRATSVIGAMLCSLGFLLSSFATGIALLYFTHGVLYGLGTSLTYTAAMLVVTRCFERKRNMATGLCASGSQFGGISLAPLSQVLFDRLGYANTFRTFSGLLLLVAIASLAYKPEYVENRTIETSSKKSPKEMLLVWKNKAYVVWTFATTLVTLGYNIPRYTLTKYAIDQGISADASAWLLSYVCLTSAIGRILFGRLCEYVPTLYLGQGCIVACGLLAFLFPFFKSYGALVLLSVISGLPDGGFIASLPTITTQIVGPEKMSEGFGFMLFCQSYSNVIGPPLAGMIFDTYHSYKAVFSFSCVPQILGALALFLIPYYTRTQMNYRQEINLDSTSGILDSDQPPSTSTCKGGDVRVPEIIGNYNVIINLPGPDSPVDIRHVNVIIQKTDGKVNCIESGSVVADITSNFGEADQGSVCLNNAASNVTIVASESVSITNENIEYLQKDASLIKVDSCPMNTNTEAKIENGTLSGTIRTNNGTLHVTPTPKTHDVVILDDIPATDGPQIITDTIIDVLSIPSESTDHHLEECHEIMNLIPNTSIPSIDICAKTPSNVTFPLAGEEIETIIKLTDEPCVPRLTPPPQVLGHHRAISDVPNINLSEPIQEPPLNNGFPPSLEILGQERLPCSNEVTFDLPPPASTPVSFNGETMVNEPPFITSVPINNTFSTVQDQLPEPLKPTSVCSVWGTTPCDGIPVEVTPNTNLDKTSATSPLSCELSTVIADVIQSLTSQNTAKVNKETNVINNLTSQSKDCLEKHESPQPDIEIVGEIRKSKESFGTAKKSSQVIPRSLVQTSFLNTMHSIVAEGCPEDSSLLEDISIDLTLDKDPSLSSIVLIGENDDTFQHATSSSCMKITSTSHGEVPHVSFQPVEPTIPGTIHQDIRTIRKNDGLVNVVAGPESTNPFYNNNLNPVPLNDTTEKVTSNDSPNPFTNTNNDPPTVETQVKASSIETTNPFYQSY